MISPRRYNERSHFLLACPVTSKAKGYPFEVRLPPGLPIAGAVLADAVRSVDYVARNLEPAGRLPEATVAEILARLRPLVG